MKRRKFIKLLSAAAAMIPCLPGLKLLSEPVHLTTGVDTSKAVYKYKYFRGHICYDTSGRGTMKVQGCNDPVSDAWVDAGEYKQENFCLSID